ncbi:MAG TPA: PilZ domain-containing protein [Thermoanaerobaculia bacterium]
MNRRRNPRRPQRLLARFWLPGEVEARRGYTTNVSATGVHVETRQPLPAGSRVRLEMSQGERGWMVEGVVAHRTVAHPELAKVKPQGMGVRFLSTVELVEEILGPLAEAAPARSTAAPAAAPPEDDGPLRVRFATAREFLQIFARDLSAGRLFVPTSRPARLDATIDLALELPPPLVGEPLLLKVRVVQRFDMPPGLGVEVLDLPGTLARLAPLVAEVRAWSGR